MDPTDIKYALAKANYSMERVAQDLSVTRQSVHDVVKGIKTSEQIHLRIAEITGIPLEKLWPSKYPSS